MILSSIISWRMNEAPVTNSTDITIVSGKMFCSHTSQQSDSSCVKCTEIWFPEPHMGRATPKNYNAFVRIKGWNLHMWYLECRQEVTRVEDRRGPTSAGCLGTDVKSATESDSFHNWNFLLCISGLECILIRVSCASISKSIRQAEKISTFIESRTAI